MSMNAVSSVAGGGEPPYHNDMDKRLTVLETRFDTILPTLATKSDVEALRAEVHVGFEKLCGEFRSENEKLRGESERLRGEFRSESEKLRGEFRGESEKLRGEFRSENAKLRGEFLSENKKLGGEFLSENERLRVDMEKRGGEMYKAIHDNTKFIVGVMVSLFIGVLAVNVTMFNVVNTRMMNLESRLAAIQQNFNPGRPPVSPVQPKAQ